MFATLGLLVIGQGLPVRVCPALSLHKQSRCQQAGWSFRKEMQVLLLRERAPWEQACAAVLRRPKGVRGPALTGSATEPGSLIVKTGATNPQSIEQAGSESDK